MASAHKITFIKNMVTGQTDGLLVDHVTGEPLTTISDGSIGVTKAFLLSPKGQDYIFTAICTGCTVGVVSLQMSPDGVNWCDCVLADGSVCSVNCNLTQDCYTKNVDVAVLQYVRLKIGNAGTSTGNCTVELHYTLN